MAQIVAGAMFSGVESGNAPGTKPGYFIGDNEGLSRLVKIDPNERNDIVGVKFFHHPTGDKRKNTEKPNDHHYLTMIVGNGHWQQQLWDDYGNSVTITLTSPGDYIAWHGIAIHHNWEALSDSTMLTIRWQRLPKETGSIGVPPVNGSGGETLLTAGQRGQH